MYEYLIVEKVKEYYKRVFVILKEKIKKAPKNLADMIARHKALCVMWVLFLLSSIFRGGINKAALFIIIVVFQVLALIAVKCLQSNKEKKKYESIKSKITKDNMYEEQHIMKNNVKLLNSFYFLKNLLSSKVVRAAGIMVFIIFFYLW